MRLKWLMSSFIIVISLSLCGAYMAQSGDNAQSSIRVTSTVSQRDIPFDIGADNNGWIYITAARENKIKAILAAWAKNKEDEDRIKAEHEAKRKSEQVTRNKRYAHAMATSQINGQGGSLGQLVYRNGHICYGECLLPSTPCVLPDYICRREAMYINEKNPHSSACGKYQFLTSTWNNYGGYNIACVAPEYIQDEKALALYDGGKGAGHWRCC
jgi:hypothetical protein